MTNQVVEGKVGIIAGAEMAVWRLQKDDFASVLESTEALIEKEKYEEFFDLAKSDFEIEAALDYKNFYFYFLTIYVTIIDGCNYEWRMSSV